MKQGNAFGKLVLRALFNASLPETFNAFKKKKKVVPGKHNKGKNIKREVCLYKRERLNKNFSCGLNIDLETLFIRDIY